jgi:hypothetical protein
MKKIVPLAILFCCILSCTLELDGTTIHIKKKHGNKTKTDTTRTVIDTLKDDSWKETIIINETKSK